MRLLLDEDSQGRSLIRLLREAGHDVATVSEANFSAHSDAEVFAFAQREHRTLLTRNGKDFEALHSVSPSHRGVLVEFQDRDPVKNMKDTDIVRAIGNIAASDWNLEGQFVAINAWNFRR